MRNTKNDFELRPVIFPEHTSYNIYKGGIFWQSAYSLKSANAKIKEHINQ